MESISPQTRKSRGMSVLSAVAGMCITFLGGIFVGLHPAWIPIKISSGTDADSFYKSSPMPVSTPASMPSDVRSGQVPTTVP